MAIDLGLKRVGKLLKLIGNPQQVYDSIHVAGTNGKGSICSYLSTALTYSQIRTGKFTSPHLITRSDCITINNAPVPHSEFIDVENMILDMDKKHNIQLTEFEVLTCTAFQIFKRRQVEMAVFEVGLGGRLDATNILQPGLPKGVIATGISKIGLDHEGILGSTLREIAFEKAGIMKTGVPCVVDGTNDTECLELFQEQATKVGTPLHVMSEPETTMTKFGDINEYQIPLLGEYQFANLSVSLKILELVSEKYPQITKESVFKGISNVEWPGRLQTLKLKYDISKPPINILVDGAHNGSAAIELSKFLALQKRHTSPLITFIMLITKGKTLKPLLSPLIQSQDNVILTQFSQPDGMPWIQSNDPETLSREFHEYTENVQIAQELHSAFAKAQELGNEIVVCGSLYLVADVLRLNNKITGIN